MAHYGEPDFCPERMARNIGVSRRAVIKKANSLGLRWHNYPVRWSEEELNELMAVTETCTLDRLTNQWNARARQKGWSPRSKKAIETMVQRLGFSISPEATMPTAGSLALALCIAPKVVVGWCKSGQIKCQKDGRSYRVRYEDFARFALDRPQTLAKYKNLNWEFVLLTLKEFTRPVDSRGVKK